MTAALAIVAECSDSKKASSKPGGGTSADFSQRYQDAICQWLAHCGQSPSIDDCRQHFNDYANYFSYTAKDFPDSIDSGRTIYDSGKAGPCFDAIARGPA